MANAGHKALQQFLHFGFKPHVIPPVLESVSILEGGMSPVSSKLANVLGDLADGLRIS